MKQIPNDIYFSMVEEEISAGRPVRFRLKGVSMFPLLRDGKDEIILYPCTADELAVMDVVLFRYKGRHLLHRIIRIEGDCLYIRGDGSYVAQEECKVWDVVGKVRTIVRPSGKEVSVESWQWRLPSFLWRSTALLRPLLLRVLHKILG